MPIYLHDFFHGGRFEQGGGDAFLDAEDHAGGGGDADGGAAELDGFEGVFDLEEAAFGGEGAAGLVNRGHVWYRGLIEAYLIPRSTSTCQFVLCDPYI